MQEYHDDADTPAHGTGKGSTNPHVIWTLISPFFPKITIFSLSWHMVKNKADGAQCTRLIQWRNAKIVGI
jgi:hypothetical protein